jgi:hypothetical protein
MAKERWTEKIEKRVYGIEFIAPILGLMPLNKELYQDYIATKMPPGEDMETKTEDEESMITEAEKGMTGFYSDSEGVYLLNYQWKGFMKKSANVLKKLIGVKNLKSKLEDYVFVFPRHLWLKEKPDGILERPLIGMTAQGQRIALAASQYVDAGVEIKVEIHRIPHDEVTWDVIEDILDYGRYHGCSQWRGAGYGAFEWKRIS